MREQMWSWLRLKGAACVIFLLHLWGRDGLDLIILKAAVLLWWSLACWRMAINAQGRYKIRDMCRRLLVLGAGAIICYSVQVASLLHHKEHAPCNGIATFVCSMERNAPELAKFMLEVTTLQTLWFSADRISYRVSSRSWQHALVATLVAVGGATSADHRLVKRMSWGHPWPSIVTLLAILMPGPFLSVAIWLLDYHWGIHWYPGADSRTKSFSLPCLFQH